MNILLSKLLLSHIGFVFAGISPMFSPTLSTGYWTYRLFTPPADWVCLARFMPQPEPEVHHICLSQHPIRPKLALFDGFVIPRDPLMPSPSESSRRGGYPPRPSQIRTCGFPASGSSSDRFAPETSARGCSGPLGPQRQNAAGGPAPLSVSVACTRLAGAVSRACFSSTALS